MGGEGSGRHPSTETIIKMSQPVYTPIGDSMFIPDYSGVQDVALKTHAPLGTGGSSQWTTSGSTIYYTGGNVGIGTTSPASLLHVAGTDYSMVVGQANPNSRVEIITPDTRGLGIISTALSSTGGAGISGFVSSIPTAADQRLGFYTLGAKDGTNNRNMVAIQGYSSQAWTSGSAAGSYMTLSTTPDNSITRTEVMRLTSNGNVGIGTTSPSVPLEVSGTGIIAGMNISNDGTKTTFLGTAGSYIRIGDAGVTSQSLASEDDLLVTGKLQIGSSTARSLMIGDPNTMSNDPAGNGILTINCDSSSGIYLVQGDWNVGGTMYLGTDAIHPSLILGTRGYGGIPETLRIRDGCVGINDVAPTEKLDVTGNINTTGIYKINDASGFTGTVTTGSLVGKTITISGGIIIGFA